MAAYVGVTPFHFEAKYVGRYLCAHCNWCDKFHWEDCCPKCGTTDKANKILGKLLISHHHVYNTFLFWTYKLSYYREIEEFLDMKGNRIHRTEQNHHSLEW